MIRTYFTRERIAAGIFFFGFYMAAYSKIVGLAFIILSPFILLRQRKNLINQNNNHKTNE